MSIRTLKIKSNNLHGSSHTSPGSGFSLNGGHRSQGWVGQTMLSRSLPRTPMKGNVVKGHGGCCGTYHRNPHGPIQSAVTSTNKNSVIKSTVMNTDGFLATHYYTSYANRPSPCSSTKPFQPNEVEAFQCNLNPRTITSSNC